jgi:hypothetical protein
MPPKRVKRRVGEKKRRMAALAVALRCDIAPTKNHGVDMAVVRT